MAKQKKLTEIVVDTLNKSLVGQFLVAEQPMGQPRVVKVLKASYLEATGGPHVSTNYEAGYALRVLTQFNDEEVVRLNEDYRKATIAEIKSYKQSLRKHLRG